MTAIDLDQVRDMLKDLWEEQNLSYGQMAIEEAQRRLGALPAIPLDRDPIEIVQQQAEEDFVEWYERTTKPAPMWAEQAREWASQLGGEDGTDLAELIGVHFFGESPRALPVLETTDVEELRRELDATKRLLTVAEEVAEARRYETDCAVGFALQRDAARAELAELRASVPVLETPPPITKEWLDALIYELPLREFRAASDGVQWVDANDLRDAILETPPPRDFFGVPWDQAPFVIMARIATALGVVDGEYENLVVDGPEELETVARRVKEKADSAGAPVEPVPPPPKSRNMKAAEASWSDPAFLRRLADSMEFIQSGRDWAPVSIDELYEMLGVEKPEFQESAPVPAPRDGLNHLDISLTNAQLQQLMDVTPVSADEAPDFWRDKLLSAPVPSPRTTDSTEISSGLVPAPRLEDVLEEIKAERDRAEAKFPDQHLPNFPAATDFERQRAEMRGAQQLCERAHKAGEVTWWHVLREEACEAFAESDPAKLRAELLQVAAMSVRWIEDLDRAVLSPPVGPQE